MFSLASSHGMAYKALGLAKSRHSFQLPFLKQPSGEVTPEDPVEARAHVAASKPRTSSPLVLLSFSLHLRLLLGLHLFLLAFVARLWSLQKGGGGGGGRQLFS